MLKKPWCHIENVSGFSLVEVLIMLTVLGLFFSAIFPLVLKNSTTNYASAMRQKAADAAQSKIEELRKTDFDTITSHTFSVLTIPGASGSLSVSHDIDGDATNEDNILKAVVTVSYNLKGATKTVVLPTLINKTGISSVR